MAEIERSQKWVAYYRVSTQRQGESGLGLDAQREAVERFVRMRGGNLLTSLTETESGKRASNRPELQKALTICRKQKAILVIAKIDRLARNVLFVAGLMESNVDFIAVDQPTKDRFTLLWIRHNTLHLKGALHCRSFVQPQLRNISSLLKGPA